MSWVTTSQLAKELDGIVSQQSIQIAAIRAHKRLGEHADRYARKQGRDWMINTEWEQVEKWRRKKQARELRHAREQQAAALEEQTHAHIAELEARVANLTGQLHHCEQEREQWRARYMESQQRFDTLLSALAAHQTPATPETMDTMETSRSDDPAEDGWKPTRPTTIEEAHELLDRLETVATQGISQRAFAQQHGVNPNTLKGMKAKAKQLLANA